MKQANKYELSLINFFNKFQIKNAQKNYNKRKYNYWFSFNLKTLSIDYFSGDKIWEIRKGKHTIKTTNLETIEKYHLIELLERENNDSN